MYYLCQWEGSGNHVYNIHCVFDSDCVDYLCTEFDCYPVICHVEGFMREWYFSGGTEEEALTNTRNKMSELNITYYIREN